MKYKVLKSCVKDGKQYHNGDSIELSKEKGEALIKQGFVQKEMKAARKTKEHKAPKKTK